MNKSGCKWCDNGPIVWIRIETKDDGPWHIDEPGNRVERCTRKLAPSEVEDAQDGSVSGAGQ